MNKTTIKIGEITIESDGTVDLEIDGNIIRVKGKQAELNPLPNPYNPFYPQVPSQWQPNPDPYKITWTKIPDNNSTGSYDWYWDGKWHWLSSSSKPQTK